MHRPFLFFCTCFFRRYGISRPAFAFLKRSTGLEKIPYAFGGRSARLVVGGLLALGLIGALGALVSDSNIMLAADSFQIQRSSNVAAAQDNAVFELSFDSFARNEDVKTHPARILLQFSRTPTAEEVEDLRASFGIEQLAPLASVESDIWLAEVAETDVVASNISAYQSALSSAMSQHELILSAEPDIVFTAYGRPHFGHYQNVQGHDSAATPNDYFYEEQWALTAINVPGAWDITTGSDKIVIAVLDSGIDPAHPDLGENVGEGYDFVGNDNEPLDDLGHGTHIASVIGGNSNNDIGVAGVNWNIEIMPIKVLDDTGTGTVSNIISGINWAADNGADIINLSLGSNKDSVLLQRTVQQVVRENGIVFVAASGNEYDMGNPITYPAVYDDVIAVGATSRTDEHASFSSGGSHLAVAAPGIEIIAATWLGSGGEYAYYTGTSMAAPIVAGVIGLMLSVNDELSPSEINGILTSTAQDIDTPGFDPRTGYGLIDAAAAVENAAAAAATATPTNTPSPTATPTPLPSTATPTRLPLTPTEVSTSEGDSEATPSPEPPGATSDEEAENRAEQFDVFVPILQ